MEKSDFRKGQTVFLLLIGNSAIGRKTVQERIVAATVASVGRKYITVDRGFSYLVQFEIDRDFRQRTNYADDYALFLDEKEIYRCCERESMERNIRDAFGWMRNVLREMSFDDVQAVHSIISKYMEDKENEQTTEL